MKRKRVLTPEVPPLAPLPPKPETLSIAWRWIAAAILVIYLGVSAGHVVYAPVYEDQSQNIINAPDEAAHWDYVEILASESRLPLRGDRTYEWHQPPLYYAVVAPAFRAGQLAARAITVLIGAISACIVFLAVRRLFPTDPVLAVLALGFAALLPMRQAVYAAVGNDALLELICSLYLLALIPAFTHGFTLRTATTLGLLLGAALLTKASAILLLPLTAVALVLLRRQADESPKSIIAGAAILFCIAATLFIPVAIRNARLYGEVTPMRAFKQEFEGTSKASDWVGRHVRANVLTGELEPGPELGRGGYFGLVVNWTCRTFVAAFTPPRLASVGVPVFADWRFYVPYLLTAMMAAAGLGRLHFRRKVDFTQIQLAFIWMMFVFTGLVILAFAAFVWTYFQAQGRYLYPAMLPMSALAALGIRAVVPPARRDAATLGILALMALLAVAFLFVYVQPTYQPGAQQP